MRFLNTMIQGHVVDRESRVFAVVLKLEFMAKIVTINIWFSSYMCHPRTIVGITKLQIRKSLIKYDF